MNKIITRVIFSEQLIALLIPFIAKSSAGITRCFEWGSFVPITDSNCEYVDVLFAPRSEDTRHRETINVDWLNDLLSVSITSGRRCPGEIVLRLVQRSANTYAPVGIYDGTGIFYYVPRDRHLPRDIYATVAGRKRRALEVERKQRRGWKASLWN